MWLTMCITLCGRAGLAYLCLITSSMTVTKAKIEVNIPRKRKGTSDQHDKVCLQGFLVNPVKKSLTRLLAAGYGTVLRADYAGDITAY